MSNEERKIDVPVVVDATGAKQGFGQVKAAAQDMAQAVQQAGATASKGTDGIGAGAAASARKIGDATGYMAAAIKRAVEANERLAAGPRGSSGYLEAQARQIGANTAAIEPYLAKLRALEVAQSGAKAATDTGAASVDKLGMSAKATAAALRGVPAQFTDIITSLQGGQRPMTVLLQQGGQLKDMFGGVGGAARALGGYVLGLVNPFTLAGGAILALAYAASQGSAETRAFQNAVTLSGNAIGLSNSQYAQLRDNLEGVAGTRGKAAEALTAIASSGLVAGDNVKGIAEAAVLMEKATGQAISKTVEQFKELSKSPADASAKLNEQYNFLTGAIYKQIKALEEQGRATEAANLAEETYAATLKSRAQTVVDNVGLMEKAWRGISGAAKSAWDTMLGIGRGTTVGEQVAKLRGTLDFEQTRNRRDGIGDKNGDTARTESLKQQIGILQENERMERRLAESQAARAQITRQTIEWEKQGEQFKTKAQKRDEELTRARKLGQDQIAAGLITEKELTERLIGIRQSYNETTGQSEVAAIVARTKEQQSYLAKLKAQAASGNYSEDVKPTPGEQLVTKIQEELKTGIMGVARAEKERALAAAKSQAEVDKQVVAQERLNKVDKESKDLLEKQAEAAGKQADSIRQRANEQEAANATFGKSKTAIEEMTLAQLRHTAAQMEATETAIPEYVAALQQQVAEQERYVAALKKSENQRLEKSLNESGRVSGEETQTLQLELSLVGQTQQVRDRIIGQRQAELKLAKEIAEIDQSGASDEDKEKRRAQARANYQVEAANAANKAVVNEWQRTADTINNSLTDALLRGFESGKSFAQNFRDTLKNMFQTLVLRPIISGVLSPVSGAISGAVQGAIGGSAGGGGLLGSIGSSVVSSQLGQALGLPSLSSMLGFGGTAASSAIAPVAAEGLGLIAPSAGIVATDAATGLAASGGFGALAAIPGWGWALGAAALLAGGMFKGGETRSGGQYLNGAFQQGPSGGQINADGVQAAIKGTTDSINASVKALGGSAQLQALYSGLESSKNGKGFAFAGGTLSTGQQFGQNFNNGYNNRRGSKDEGQAFAEFTEELKQATLQALQASDIKGQLADYIRSLGDIDALTGGSLDTAYNRVQKAMTERAQLQEKLDQLTMATTSAEEQLAKAREKERTAIDATNQDLLEQIYAQQDLATASANLVTAYNAQQQELQGQVDSLRQYAKSLRSFVQGLAASSGATATERTALARAQFDATLAAAHGGDADARSTLTGTASDYLSALKATARSSAEYALGVARVTGSLTTEAAGADAQATIQQQQLDTAKAQLTQLGLLNVNVQTFAQAWVAYQDAKAKADTLVTSQAAAVAAAAVASTPADSPVLRALRNGKSGSIGGAIDDVLNYQNVFGYAAGGDHEGGWRMVGEKGRELEATGPSRIFSADQTTDIVSGLGNGAKAAAYMRDAVFEIRGLRAEMRAGSVEQVKSLQVMAAKMKKWDGNGTPPVRVEVPA